MKRLRDYRGGDAMLRMEEEVATAADEYAKGEDAAVDKLIELMTPGFNQAMTIIHARRGADRMRWVER